MLLVVGVLVVVGGGLGAWLGTRPASSAAATATRVVTVTPSTLDQSVSATGTVEPAQQADLSFAVSGVVTAVDVAVGQQVAAGQTLGTLDPTELDAALAQAQATLALDQARLSSDQAAGASTAQLDADNAAIAAAEAQVTSAQTDVSDATLASTIAGTVASVDVAVGESVGGGGSTASGSGSAAGGASATGASGATGGSTGGSGSSVAGTQSSSTTGEFVVVSTGSFVVDTSVDDSQVGQVATGDQAVVTIAGSTTPVYGTVGSVGLEATASSGVASFPVVVDVTGSPSGLYGGTTATVTIITKVLQGVLEVPTLALHTTASGAVTVDLLAGGHDVTRDVKVGIAAGGETQVISGLTAGDQVVVPTRRVTRLGTAA